MSVAAIISPEQQRVRAGRGSAAKREKLATQINVRMDASLKARAEEAFTNAGLSSSDVVRAAFARAAELGRDLTCMGDIVRMAPVDDESFERENKMRIFERATHSVERAFESLGLTYDPSHCVPMTEEEIEAQFYGDFIEGNM